LTGFVQALEFGFWFCGQCRRSFQIFVSLAEMERKEGKWKKKKKLTKKEPKFGHTRRVLSKAGRFLVTFWCRSEFVGVLLYTGSALPRMLYILTKNAFSVRPQSKEKEKESRVTRWSWNRKEKANANLFKHKLFLLFALIFRKQVSHSCL
jgi:hypothetical protein